MKNFKLVWSARSECGPNRKKNEDTIYPSTSGNNQPPFKAAVCDGLGGHVSGDIASKIAADTLNEEVGDLKKVINQANKQILQFQDDNPESLGMGTTMTVITINENALMKIAHVGDSRCYVLSDRNLVKVTEDQNVPGYQNVLKQALGSNEKLKIQEIDFQLHKDSAVCANGAMYRTDIRGFLPEIMEKIYTERTVYKKKMLAAKQKYEDTKDPKLV